MPESFGRYLKRERQLREITLEQIAVETKIKIGLLRALEDDRIEALPSPAIVKGFLRAYARSLGLSGNDLQLRYQSFLEEVAPERLRPRSLRPWVPGKRRRLGPVGWLLLIALGVGVGLHLTGGEPARSPENAATSGADGSVVYQRNYLSGLSTDAPPGTPPRVAASSPDWPGPDSGGVTVLLRAVAPTDVSVTLDGGPPQAVALLPGQPVVRHAFTGMVIAVPEPTFVEVEVNGETLPPEVRTREPRRIVLGAPSVPAPQAERPPPGIPFPSLEADATGEAPIPSFPPLVGLDLAGSVARTPAIRTLRPRTAAPTAPPESPAAPSDSAPKDR